MKLIVDTDFVQNRSNKDGQLPKKKEKIKQLFIEKFTRKKIILNVQLNQFPDTHPTQQSCILFVLTRWH